jgi:hypothetical protein
LHRHILTGIRQGESLMVSYLTPDQRIMSFHATQALTRTSPRLGIESIGLPNDQ